MTKEKESGIEKLLELLNDYEQEEGCWRLKYGKLHNKYYDEYDYKDEEIRLISKWYGFIKWLVENEKIEYKNLNKIHTRKGLNVLIEQELYEDLIMLLSIQDEPIEFLVSILK